MKLIVVQWVFLIVQKPLLLFHKWWFLFTLDLGSFFYYSEILCTYRIPC